MRKHEQSHRAWTAMRVTKDHVRFVMGRFSDETFRRCWSQVFHTKEVYFWNPSNVRLWKDVCLISVYVVILRARVQYGFPSDGSLEKRSATVATCVKKYGFPGLILPAWGVFQFTQTLARKPITTWAFKAKITGSSCAAGCMRNLLPGSAPISLQWFSLYVSFSNIWKASAVTHTNRIDRNLLREETSFVCNTSSALRKSRHMKQKEKITYCC